jgi:hypothetical protein
MVAVGAGLLAVIQQNRSRLDPANKEEHPLLSLPIMFLNNHVDCLDEKSGFLDLFFEATSQSFQFALGNELTDISTIQTNKRTGLGTGYTENPAGNKDIGHASDTQVTETQIFTATGHTGELTDILHECLQIDIIAWLKKDFEVKNRLFKATGHNNKYT